MVILQHFIHRLEAYSHLVHCNKQLEGKVCSVARFFTHPSDFCPQLQTFELLLTTLKTTSENTVGVQCSEKYITLPAHDGRSHEIARLGDPCLESAIEIDIPNILIRETTSVGRTSLSFHENGPIQLVAFHCPWR